MLDYITKFLEDGTVDEADRDIDGGFTSGLDGSIGLKEWKSLAAVHERFITWHPKVSNQIWLFVFVLLYILILFKLDAKSMAIVFEYIFSPSVSTVLITHSCQKDI